eukprot:g32257.t1
MPAAGGSAGRKLVSTKRLRGNVIEWFDKYGWIQANEAINHPQANRNGGRIYLQGEDVQDDLPGVGCAVTFFLYEDANGLGAMNVRPDSQAHVQRAQALASFAVCKPATATFSILGFHSKWQVGRPTPQSFAAQFPSPHQTAAAKAGRTNSLTDSVRCEAQIVQARVKPVQYRGGYAPVMSGPVKSHEEVLQKVHSSLNKQVWKATGKIADREKDWDHTELCKRVVKYLYKGAQAPELLTLPWQQAAMQFIENAMRGYSNACAQKDWFFDMDLTSTFHMAFWEIFSGSGQSAQWPEVEAILNSKYEELMDDCLLEKAMWDSSGIFLPDNEPLRNKLYKGLKNGHEAALKEVSTIYLRDDLQRVEAFTRSWIHHSLGKAWQAAEQGGLMNHESAVMLFQELLAPYGEEHPFSCVPSALTKTIGRPPRDWDFLQEAVRRETLETPGKLLKLLKLADI